MKIVDEDAIPTQTVPEALQSISKPSPIDEGYHLIEGLPSALKLYPEGTEIYGRSLKVLEVKSLSSINETNADNIINSILRRSIKGIDVDKILVSDKLYILMWLRGTSFPSSEYGIPFKCSSCEKEVKYIFELNKIETRQIDENFTIDKLKFTLPNKDVIDFAFPTIAEEKLAENFKATCPYIKDIDSDIVGQCVLIKAINGESKTMLEKYNYLTTMNPNDYCFFLSYVERWSFGIKWVIQATCSLCGGSTAIGATFFADSDFWLPRISID